MSASDLPAAPNFVLVPTLIRIFDDNFGVSPACLILHLHHSPIYKPSLSESFHLGIKEELLAVAWCQKEGSEACDALDLKSESAQRSEVRQVQVIQHLPVNSCQPKYLPTWILIFDFPPPTPISYPPSTL